MTTSTSIIVPNIIGLSDQNLPKSSACGEHCFSRLNDALEPFAQAVKHSWASGSMVRLHCTVPTSPSRNADLHDMYQLHSRSFGFLHALVKLLRASGIYASYHLTFSPASLVMVRALPPTEDPVGQQDAALERAKACDRNTATVLVLEDTPILVVT